MLYIKYGEKNHTEAVVSKICEGKYKMTIYLIKKSCKGAFTLVELLVVIAIISVLAGMLMPALENAIGSARTMVCTNNLKQIGIGTRCYLDDFDGYFFKYWDGTVGWYFNKDHAFNNLYLGSADYRKVGTVLDCPSGKNGWFGPDKSTPGNQNGNFDYGVNAVFSNEPILRNERKLAGYESETVIFCDAKRYHLDENNYDSPLELYGVQWDHQDEQGSNFLFYDSHVSTRMMETISEENFHPW